MGYHTKQIKKGVYREFSKIEEEFEELKDAVDQSDQILILIEMSDLVGAMQGYLEKHFGAAVGLEDLIDFSNKTKQEFKEGGRV